MRRTTLIPSGRMLSRFHPSTSAGYKETTTEGTAISRDHAEDGKKEKRKLRTDGHARRVSESAKAEYASPPGG